jgi:hypothetical protein
MTCPEFFPLGQVSVTLTGIKIQSPALHYDSTNFTAIR